MGLKSAELQDKIKYMDSLIEQAGNLSDRNQLEAQRNELNEQLQSALADETQQQERIDAQAEKIEAIKLPYDYNEILGNPLANETIIENVKQFQLQAYEEHNAEVARINSEHAEMVGMLNQAGNDNAARYREVLQSLETRLETLQENYDNVHSQLYTALLEKADAESTRDNAAQLLVEANEELEKHKQSTIENCELRKEIEELKQELTAKKAITVSGNEKLAELAAKAKESTAAAAQRGIERWNQQYGMDIPVLEVPDVQPVNPVTEEEAPAQENSFQSDQISAAELGLVDQSLSLQGAETDEIEHEDMKLFPDDYLVTMKQFNALAARVENIERHANIQAVA